MIPEQFEFDLSDVEVAPKAKGQRRFLLVEQPDGSHALQIDNTSLEVFTTCPRSAEYRLVYGRSPHATEALVAGSGIHEGLETYYKGVRLGHDREEVIQRALIASTEPFADFNQYTWRTPDRVIDTLLRYFNNYQSEPFTINIDANGLPTVELAFSLPLGVVDLGGVTPNYPASLLCSNPTDPEKPLALGEVHVYWTGKIDLAVTMDNRFWVVDHKTASMMGDTFWNNFYLSNQTVGYTWAAEKIFGEPCTGLLVNCLYWRPPTAKGEMKTEFHRQRFFYDAQQVLEWQRNAHAAVADFLSNLARNYFPQYTSWCQGKFGACRYFGTCSMPSQLRLSDLATSNYSDTTWSPLNQ